MITNFKSNKLLDIAIFSGVDVNYENQAPKDLIGQAAKKALEQLKTSYNEYKEKLNLKYGQFLRNVEANLGELNKAEMPSNVRISVASKLSELANTRVTQVESKFSWIYKIFLKIGQLFRGHGFRTEGEWGFELASRMEKVESKIYKTQLNKCIFNPGYRINGAPPSEFLGGMKDKINALSEEKFKEVLNDIVFKKKENLHFGEKNKFIFYKNLSKEKKKIFDQELLSRNDWYSQACDIIEGADDEEFPNFVSSEMVKRFQENSSQVVGAYSKSNHNNAWLERFFYTMVESAIKDYLAQNSVEGYQKISSLLNGNWSVIKWKTIVENPKILTEEEIRKLQDNVRLCRFM